jgi:hypothetical protein
MKGAGIMTMIERVWEKARRSVRAIVLPEGDEPRTVQAAARIHKEGLARPILLGDPERIQAVAREKGADIAGIEIVNPAASPKLEAYAGALYELRKAKGLSREDAATFRRAGFDFTDLKTFRRLAGRTGLGRYMSLVDQAGGTDNLLRIERCAAGIRVKTERAVRYIRSQLPQCAQYAPPISQIIRTWEDYLNMAGELQLDLTETTVAMPKDLKARHDAAAEHIRHNADEAEKKKYGKRRRLLEKKFGFELNGLRILVPGSAREIVEEGKTLHHCVGGYAPRHITGSTTILFLRHARRPERSWLTIEMTERKGRAEIAQIHGYRNEGYELTGGKRGAPPEDKYAWFLGPWLEWVNDGSPRDRKGAPILKNQEGMAG